jgi:hypothetical protein
MKVGGILVLYGVTDVSAVTGWEAAGDHCWRKLPA